MAKLIGIVTWLFLIGIVLIGISEGWILEGALKIVVIGAVALIVVFPIGYGYGLRLRSKDRQILAQEPEDFLATVRRMQREGVPYQERLRYLRDKGVSKATAEQVLANAVMEPDQPPPQAAPGEQPPLVSLLANTHAAWKSGKLSGCSPVFAAEAKSNPPRTFTDSYLKLLGERISRHFEEQPPEADEFMVAFHETGFLLTSKRLFLFYKQMPQGQPRTVMLKTIRQYRTQGLWTKTLKILLQSGQELCLKDLDSVPDDQYVNTLLGAAVTPLR